MLKCDADAGRLGAGGESSPVPRIPSHVFVEVVRLLIVAMTTAMGETVGGGVGAALGACAGYVIGGVAGRRLRTEAGRFEDRVERTPAMTLVGGAIGALAASSVGVIAGIAAVVLLPGRWGWPVLGVGAWTGVYAGFQVGARKGDELVSLLRHGSATTTDAPHAEVVLVDTSAAIDGRLLVLARSGFLPGDLAVPRFVLDELRRQSDSTDDTIRRRARRGLEALEALRAGGPGLRVLPDEVPESETTASTLVALALRLGARVLTADGGLSGVAGVAAVAGVEGVVCLDMVKLADALQARFVPGEVVSVRVTREGRDPGQGVGYLGDGAMVVVAGASGRMGENVEVEVTTSVPTTKGRLYFATLYE